MKKFSTFICSGMVVLYIFTLLALPAFAQIFEDRDRSPLSTELSDEQRLRRSVFGSGAGLQNIDLRQLVAIVIQALLSLLAILFLGLIIYGGYVWMMARGNETEVQRAKGIIRNSVVGLIVVMSSYAIGYFILYYLTTGGTGANAPLGS